MTGNVLVTMDGIERCVARRIFERDRGNVVAARLFREGSHGIEDDAPGHIGRARGARLGQERPRKSFLRSPTSENGPSTNSLMCQTPGRELKL